MSPKRLAVLIGVALLVMIVNVAISFGYVAFYSYLINPGHPSGFYRDYATIAAPYSSIVAGIPLFFLAGRWAARTAASSSRTRDALVVWVSYATIDVAVLFGSGTTARVALLATISMVTKLGAALLGARRAGGRP